MADRQIHAQIAQATDDEGAEQHAQAEDAQPKQPLPADQASAQPAAGKQVGPQVRDAQSLWRFSAHMQCSPVMLARMGIASHMRNACTARVQRRHTLTGEQRAGPACQQQTQGHCCAHQAKHK